MKPAEKLPATDGTIEEVNMFPVAPKPASPATTETPAEKNGMLG